MKMGKKNKRVSRHVKKAGLPPGTLVYTGEKKLETVRKMLAEGLDLTVIMNCTGLSAEEVAALSDEERPKT